MLRGHYTAKFDDKGRVKIPAEFAEEFLQLCGGSRRIFITSLDGETALIYPLPVWEEFEIRLAALPTADPDVENYIRTVSYWGRETPIDAQGRLLLHPLLRESALDSLEASVFGRQRFLEICDHNRLKKTRLSVTREERSALASKYNL